MKKSGVLLLTGLVCLLIAAGVFYAAKRAGNDSKHGSTAPSGMLKTTTSTQQVTGLNFVAAANAVTPAVVHIKTIYKNAGTAVFGMQPRRGMGSGSGVIIDENGYIATNNHVIENASKIEVILPDRRRLEASLVGRDPNTDLALLKVKGNKFPVIRMGNSDNVQVGEWVLAVGYPYSLNTTVTAGIISAKGRSIGIIADANEQAFPGAGQGSTAIESFIQTDAAINPGNSGGALVNLNGELIGINTAIASMTGSYAGYAFAIPVNLATKILNDIKEFGEVKRGILGVSFPTPAAEDAYLLQQGIDPTNVKGVFITDVLEGSAAASAGLKAGDVIQQIDGIKIYSSPEFSERIARHRPGDKLELNYLRDGKSNTVKVTLKGEETVAAPGNDQALREIYEKLGATFAPVPPALIERFDIAGGVVVTEVRNGGFFYQLGIPPGTIIAYINGREVNSPADIEAALINARNARVQMLGIAPDGSRVAFNFSLGA